MGRLPLLKYTTEKRGTLLLTSLLTVSRRAGPELPEERRCRQVQEFGALAFAATMNVRQAEPRPFACGLPGFGRRRWTGLKKILPNNGTQPSRLGNWEKGAWQVPGVVGPREQCAPRAGELHHLLLR